MLSRTGLVAAMLMLLIPLRVEAIGLLDTFWGVPPSQDQKWNECHRNNILIPIVGGLGFGAAGAAWAVQSANRDWSADSGGSLQAYRVRRMLLGGGIGLLVGGVGLAVVLPSCGDGGRNQVESSELTMSLEDCKWFRERNISRWTWLSGIAGGAIGSWLFTKDLEYEARLMGFVLGPLGAFVGGGVGALSGWIVGRCLQASCADHS